MAIGVLDREETVFSIPIRTIFREKGEDVSYSVCPHIKKSKMSQEIGKCHYGVGSGIVWDSEVDLEYEELQIKMKFLKQDFCLLETMLYTPYRYSSRVFDFTSRSDFSFFVFGAIAKECRGFGFCLSSGFAREIDGF